MIFGLIAGAFSAVVGAVSSAISVVGSFVASVGKIVIDGISAISAIIGKIGQALGIIPQNTNMEEFGDKALQASEAGIKPENFDNYQDYINEVKNFNIDPEKSKKFSLEEKQLAATGITVKGIENKFDLKEGSLGDLLTLTALNDGKYFNADRITQMIKSGSDIEKVTQYFEGNLGFSDKKAVEKELVKVDQSLDPEKTEDEILAEIDATTEDLQKAIEKNA